VVSVRAEKSGDVWVCQVVVDDAGERTLHQVTVTREDLERWGQGSRQADVEDLVSRSFDFLIEREPPTSILASFELSVIQRYFPEYDAAFRRSRHDPR
jgi:hypothetical protein